MRPFDAKALASAERVALWTIQNLQDPSGFFHYQIRRFFRNRIPYMRWGQAWMQRALTELSLAVSGAFADARQGSR
jgi:hypothetical protein